MSNFKKGRQLSLKKYTNKNQQNNQQPNENLEQYFKSPQNPKNNLQSSHRKNKINTKIIDFPQDSIIQNNLDNSPDIKKPLSQRNTRIKDLSLNSTNYNSNFISQHQSPNSSFNNQVTDTLKRQKFPSQHLSHKSSYSQYQKNYSLQQKLHQQQINHQFASISDIWDKNQVLNALKSLETKEQRLILVDKILQRREEQKNSHHQMQISKVAPLVNRFIRKIGHKHTKFQSQILNAQNSKDKVLQHAGTLQMFLGGMGKVTNGQNIDEDIIKKIEAQEEGIYEEVVPSPRNTKIGHKGYSPLKLKKVKTKSENNSNNNMMQKKTNLTNLRKERKINLAKVTEKSKKLIDLGVKKQIYKNTNLLSNFQLKNLSSHFKSKLDKNNSQLDINHINTFEIGNSLRPDTTQHKGLLYTNKVFDSVVDDITGYFDQTNIFQQDDFFLPANSFKSAESQIIELRALRKTLQDSQFFKNFQNQRKSTLIGINKVKEEEKQLNQKRRKTISVDDFYSMGFQSMSSKKPQQESIIDCQHSKIMFTPQPKLDQNKKIRFYQVYQEDQEVEQGDCIHDELEKPELNESFASYTEIKLDLLYKNSKQLKQQHQLLEMNQMGDKQALIHLIQQKRSRNYNPEKLKKQYQKIKEDLDTNYKQIIDLSKQKIKNNNIN